MPKGNKIKNEELIKKQKKKKGFTLVELIVVITIIAILGTIAFISINTYTIHARNGVRIADLNNIKKSLELFIVEKGFYPTPDGLVSITYSGATAWTQGTIGDTVIRNLQKLNKKPTDPLTGNEYTYSITNLKSEYQLGTIYEGGVSIGYTPIITEKANAAGEKKALAMVIGTYNEKILKVSTGSIDYILAVPSIINTNLYDTDLLSIINNKSLSYDKYSNLPSSYENNGYTMTGGFDFVPGGDIVVYSGSTHNLIENNEKLVFIDNLKNVYYGTILGTNGNYSDITSLDTVNNQGGGIELANSYLKNDIGGIGGGINQLYLVTNDCTLDGKTIYDGQTITAYSENNIGALEPYECADRQTTRTCNNRTLSGDINYQYTSCVKGTPANCSASGSYSYNSHTYSIPAVNHGEQAINITSSSVTENNGTFTYTLTSIDCNDGGLINPNENVTPTVVSCDTNYHISGNSCVLDTYTVSGSFGINANGATINVCGTNVTADASGGFSTTRNYGSVCNDITAARSGYTCTTTINGPTSLISNVTNIAGSCSTNFTCGNSISYGGYTYTTKTGLDGKCWTTTNMKHGSMLANGAYPSSINTIEKWCYNNTASYCNTYGGLYTWYEAMGLPQNSSLTTEDTTKSVCGIMGDGWHLPTDAQFYSLENASKTAGQTCTSSRTSWECNGAGWIGNKDNGVFTVLGGHFYLGSTYPLDSTGYWWSSTQISSANAWYRLMMNTQSTINRSDEVKAQYGFSIVCTRN
nr:FISUMP domain-containing protein [Candidatus Gracilibacteria bacterium]